MAFQLKETYDDGTAAEYWRIVNMELDYVRPSGRLVVAGYRTDADREEYPLEGIVRRAGPYEFGPEAAGEYLSYEDALPIEATWEHVATGGPGADPDLLGAASEAESPMLLTWDVQNRRTKGFQISRWAVTGIALDWATQAGTLHYAGYTSDERRSAGLENFATRRQASYAQVFDRLFGGQSLEESGGFDRSDAYHLLKTHTERFASASQT